MTEIVRKIRASEIPFPTGRLNMEGDGVNTIATKEQAAAGVEKYNTGAQHKRIVEDPSSSLYNYLLDDGSGFSLVRPTGKYSYRSAMAVMYARNFPDIASQTQMLYRDYSQVAQVEYGKNVVSGLRAMTELTADSPNIFVAYVENNISTVTSRVVRTSRSLTLHHGQFVEIDTKALDDKSVSLAHLEEEQAFLRGSGFDGAVDEIAEAVLKRTGYDLGFERRMIAPVGYAFELPNDEPDTMQELLSAHFYAYSRVSEKYFRDFGQIPSPSYRFYMKLGSEGNPVVMVSPQRYSHAGSIEAAGIDLNRSRQHVNPYETDEVELFHQKLAHKMFATL